MASSPRPPVIGYGGGQVPDDVTTGAPAAAAAASRSVAVLTLIVVASLCAVVGAVYLLIYFKSIEPTAVSPRCAETAEPIEQRVSRSCRSRWFGISLEVRTFVPTSICRPRFRSWPVSRPKLRSWSRLGLVGLVSVYRPNASSRSQGQNYGLGLEPRAKMSVSVVASISEVWP